MSAGRRRGRPTPLRWGGSVAVAGLVIAGVGGYLQFGPDRAGASTPPAGAGPAAGPPAVARTAPLPDESATASPPSGTTKNPARVAPRPGRPSGISIPQLAVTAPVLGITADNGALTPPSDASKVGWWSGGAQPGAAKGSAVITGHTVHAGGGAFDDLETLRPGADVTVATARGVLRYEVTSVTTYRRAALAADAADLFDQRVAGRLVLVTCEDWNGEVYLSNVVVVARRIA